MCWPDIRDYLKGLIPLIEPAAVLVTYVALVALLLWAPRVHKSWLRIASRILGGAGIVPFVILLPVVLFAYFLSLGEPAAKIRTVQSTDGQQAKVRYYAGFLGRDSTVIILKRTGCCAHTTVFGHDGPSWFDDPKVTWLDNRNLQISYHSRVDDPQHCEEREGNIRVICNSSPWPEPAAEGQVQQPQSNGRKP